MDTSKLITAPSLYEALSTNIRCTQKGQYELILPASFCFGPRIFGGLVMSMVHQATESYFTEKHPRYNQPHVISMQWQFFRQVYPSIANLVIHDIHIGESGSLLQATISQKGQSCMISLVNMANLQVSRGLSFESGWKLDPPTIEASISSLAADCDPRWVSYQTPYHPESFRRVQSYVKFYVPYKLQQSHIRDHWITPADSGVSFTTEMLGFLLDLSLPIIDNYLPNESTGGQMASIAAGLEQKKDREAGIAKVIDPSSGAFESPAVYLSLSTTMEIKKTLPARGVKWLFMRAYAKEIKNGRMSMEVVIVDESLELVALSQQLCPLVELSRMKTSKERL